MASGKSLFELAEIVTNKEGQDYTCPAIPPALPISELPTTRIDETEEFRPDKIANRLYRDPTFSWVIDYANGFTGKEKFSAYKSGLMIKYVREETLRSMGLLF